MFRLTLPRVAPVHEGEESSLIAHGQLQRRQVVNDDQRWLLTHTSGFDGGEPILG